VAPARAEVRCSRWPAADAAALFAPCHAPRGVTEDGLPKNGAAEPDAIVEPAGVSLGPPQCGQVKVSDGTAFRHVSQIARAIAPSSNSCGVLLSRKYPTLGYLIGSVFLVKL